MKKLLTTTLISVFLVSCAQAQMRQQQSRGLTLAKDGQTTYSIVLPEEATVVEQTAAKELKEHLDQVTGASFAVVKESEATANQPQILIGRTAKLKTLLPRLDLAKVPYDGIVIKTVGRDLVLTGHEKRGALYAVFTFLENPVGIRWWTSSESFIPKKPTLVIPGQNTEYAPKLIYREAHYQDTYNPVYPARMRCNGAITPVAEEYGSHHMFAGSFVHSFFPLIPPEKYFAEHPEWFSEIDGVRKHERAQLCLTNDAMREELTKNALEVLRNNPKGTFLSISQNDWYGYCECEKCKAVVAEEGGAQSGLMLRFVNRVAEDVEKEFTNVLVETLAYQYTRKPPKITKPRENVVIRLCSIECSFVQPLARGAQNKDFRDDIEGWSKIAKRLFVWDYVTNFNGYMLPHPNIRVLAPNIRFFVDNHTIGLFEQGDHHCSAGDFVQMRQWVIAHLLWDQRLNERQLMNEFLVGYYGPEIAKIYTEYWDLLCNQAEKSGIFLRCFMKNTTAWLDLDTLEKATALMNRALEIAEKSNDPVLLKRVQKAKIPIDLVWIMSYETLRQIAKLEGKPFTGPPDPKEACDQFFAMCDSFGVNNYQEPQSPNEYQAFKEGFISRYANVAIGPPAFCESLPEGTWLSAEEFQMNMRRPGEHSMLVDDPAAGNKRAMRMPSNHNNKATAYYFDKTIELLKPVKPGSKTPKFHLYAAVRADAKATEGGGLNVGLFDEFLGKPIMSAEIPVSEIAGSEYKWIDLGILDLNTNRNFWFAPPNRPADEVEAVYIDRVVVVREE